MRPDSRVGMRSLCVALAGRPVAFRGEEGKKKKPINASQYWQRGGNEGQPRASFTRP